jgi:TonB-dependent SusC/RagA subfamily outer membrane receptor
MNLAHLTSALALITAATACTAERTVAPQPLTPAFASSATVGLSQIPLLYVVDGVRLAKDQVPSLTSEEISAVKVLKGRAALAQFGPDASYGVVLITTKASTPRS